MLPKPDDLTSYRQGRTQCPVARLSQLGKRSVYPVHHKYFALKLGGNSRLLEKVARKIGAFLMLMQQAKIHVYARPEDTVFVQMFTARRFARAGYVHDAHRTA
jgi:hypothetical protein